MVPFGQQVGNYYYSGAQMTRNSSYETFKAYDYNFTKLRRSKEENKKQAAINHSLAERNRRMRINSQYETLKKLFRNNEKRDKASLLAATIEIVNKLKKTTNTKEEASSSKRMKEASSKNEEASTSNKGNNEASNNNPTDVIFPSWENKWNLRHEEGLMKATLNCEDKQELMSTIAKALGSVEAKVAKAEMVSVGGRTRIVLWVKDLSKDGNKCEDILKRTLSALIQRPIPRRRRYNQ